MNLWDAVPEDERNAIALGEATLVRLEKAETAESWYRIGAAAHLLMSAAMAAGGANKPLGRGYIKAWDELKVHAPRTAALSKSTRSLSVWLYANWEAVNTWMQTLTPNLRVELNHPRSIKRRYDAAHVVPTPDDDDGAATTTNKRTSYKQALADAEADKAKLKEENAVLQQRLRTEGSLFNIHQDRPGEIARAVVGNVSPTRAEAIAKAILTEVKRRRALQGHAG